MINQTLVSGFVMGLIAFGLWYVLKTTTVMDEVHERNIILLLMVFMQTFMHLIAAQREFQFLIMIAKLENGLINVYDNQNILIGAIKTKSNFQNAEITIEDETYELNRKKWVAKIIKKGKTIYTLKTNPFSGNTKIIETKQKIKGAKGLKWGTKLIDKNKDTLVKIKNQNQFLDNKKYDIEISNKDVNKLDILLTLYGHLYGSSIIFKPLL